MNDSPVTTQDFTEYARQAGYDDTSGLRERSRDSPRSSSLGSQLMAYLFPHRRASGTRGPSSHSAPALAKDPEERRKPSSQDGSVSGSQLARNNMHHDGQTPGNDPLKHIEGQYLQQLNRKDEEIKELRMENHRLTQQYEQMARQTRSIFEENRCLKNEKAHVEKNLEHLENECGRLQSVALTAQEGALQAIAKGMWATKEDRTVRDELAKLQDGQRSWARKYSKITIDGELASSPLSQKIIEQLEAYCQPSDWSTLLERLPISQNKVPMLLVQTLLAKDIFARIFDDPFFAFPANTQDPSFPHREELHVLYDTMLKINPVEAHIWRSQMMRVLTSASNTPRNDGLLLLDRLRKLSSDRALMYLRGPASALLRDWKDEIAYQKCFEELRGLYETAAELALALWCQRTYMRCLSQQDLGEFHSSSSLMAAHRLHHLDEDDDRLNGKRILVTVQPAVLAFGNENAEGYDQRKVWAPAVVLVEEGG